MNINKVLMEYDNMFGVSSMVEIEDFLLEMLYKANEEHDDYSAVTLQNELIGFYRDTSQNDKGLKYCGQVISRMKQLGIDGTVEYATSLINVANAYRAFGLHDKSLELYREVERIYREKLPAGEFNYASLYNNWSLLYQEMNDFENARLMLMKALAVVDLFPKAVIQQANTRTNLAVTLLRISQTQELTGSSGSGTNQDDKRNGGANGGLSGMPHSDSADAFDSGYDAYLEAMKYLNEALEIFELDGERDFHYSAALSAMGDALYMKGFYLEAASYYERAMQEIDRHVGRTEAYERVAENYADAVNHAEEVRKQKEAFWNKAVENEESGNEDFRNKENLSEKSSFAKLGTGENELDKLTTEEAQLEECGNDEIRYSYDEDSAEMSDIFTSNGHIYNNNLERCRAFYKMYGAPMIHEQFGEYEKRIAVGLVGEGSDCFGFDDDISMDHDYGVGFCMWLSDEDYDKIGFALHKVYERLVLEHGREFIDINVGVYGESVNRFMDGRRGVFRIDSFYEDILGVGIDSKKVFSERNAGGSADILDEQQWLEISEDKLATAVNGKVFRDDAGVFTSVRKALKAYYPKRVWMLRIAKKMHDFSQYAQSNYARMMAREDYVTAQVCMAEGMKSAMELAYLLNRKYAPYYKWYRKGMQRLTALGEIMPILDKIAVTKNQAKAWFNTPYNPYEINREDKIVTAFEDVAEWILDELNTQGIVQGTDSFLDVYFNAIVSEAMELPGNDNVDAWEKYPSDSGTNVGRSEAIKMGAVNVHDALVDRIVGIEWQQFDKVKNEGGRADCQNDWNTFSLMRKSQYLAWNDELLVSYLNDLEEAGKNGWNLIMEKYARMMESTAPERYAELAGELPERDSDRIAIQEEIIRIQVAWMEEFASKYPKMAGNARSIHTSEDNPYNTSYETYLRGELGTYSADTLLLYGRFVVDLQKQGKNLAYMIMENTAKLYGYKSLEDAESRL